MLGERESVWGEMWPLVGYPYTSGWLLLPPHHRHLLISDANNTQWVIKQETGNKKDMKLGRSGGVGGEWGMGVTKIHYKHIHSLKNEVYKKALRWLCEADEE